MHRAGGRGKHRRPAPHGQVGAGVAVRPPRPAGPQLRQVDVPRPVGSGNTTAPACIEARTGTRGQASPPQWSADGSTLLSRAPCQRLVVGVGVWERRRLHPLRCHGDRHAPPNPRPAPGRRRTSRPPRSGPSARPSTPTTATAAGTPPASRGQSRPPRVATTATTRRPAWSTAGPSLAVVRVVPEPRLLDATANATTSAWSGRRRRLPSAMTAAALRRCERVEPVGLAPRRQPSIRLVASSARVAIEPCATEERDDEQRPRSAHRADEEA